MTRKSPILTAIDRLITDQEHRHAWLFKAADQIRAMNAQEAQDKEGIAK